MGLSTDACILKHAKARNLNNYGDLQLDIMGSKLQKSLIYLGCPALSAQVIELQRLDKATFHFSC